MSGDELREATAGEEIAPETKASASASGPTGESIESELPFGMPSRSMAGEKAKSARAGSGSFCLTSIMIETFEKIALRHGSSDIHVPGGRGRR